MIAMNRLLMLVTASLLLVPPRTFAQARPDNRLEERRLPSPILRRESLPESVILQQREWASPTPSRRAGPSTEKEAAVPPAPTFADQNRDTVPLAEKQEAVPPAPALADAPRKVRAAKVVQPQPIIQAGKEQPDASGCKVVDEALRLAEDSYRRQQDLQALNPLYALAECSAASAGLLITHSQQWLALDDWLSFIRQLAPRGPDTETLQGIVLGRAWSLLNENALPDSQRIFEFARENFPDARQDSRHGLALLAFRQNRFADAMQHAAALDDSHPARPALLSDIALAAGWAALDAGEAAMARNHFGQSLIHPPNVVSARHGLALIALKERQLVEALSLIESLPADHPQRAALLRNAKLDIAWQNFGQGLESAYSGFEQLYRENPDVPSAEGLVNAARRFGKLDEIDLLAQSEPLAGLYRRQRAEMAFADKRYLLARQWDPERYRDLGGSDPTSLGISFARRTKKTSSSLTRMNWQPAAALRWLGEKGDEWSFHAERLLVDVDGNHESGLQSRLGWRRETQAGSWEAELGRTPDAGPVDAGIEGLLAHTWHLDQQQVRLSAYRQPVRDSATSYIGYRGWGRVMASGMQGEWRGSVYDRWSASLAVKQESLDGHRVADNRRLNGQVGAGYALPLPGFDYAVLSLNILEDRYDKNLAQDLPGHGHYFSPQKYRRIGPAFDFMTEERKSFMLKGRAAFGRTRQFEEATPVNPLAGTGGMLPEAKASGSAYDYEIGGAWLATPSVQIGGWGTQRKSLDYRDRALMLSISILFEPRRNVLSSDLPNALAARLY